MKKKGILQLEGLLFGLLVILSTDTCLAFWPPHYNDGMEMLKTNISIAASQRHQWYPCVTYNSIDKEYMAVWWESGPMNDTDTISYHSVNGQRISPDGKPIGNPFEIDPPEQGWKTLTAPFLAHDSFTNEYMVAFTTGAGYMPQHLNVARINNTGALQFSDMVYESPYNVNHPAVVFI